MALKGFDGFDHYNGIADMQSRSNFLQWQQESYGGTGSMTIAFVPGLTAAVSPYGQAVKMTNAVSGIINGTTMLRAVFGARNQEAYFGVRIKGVGTGLWMLVGDSIAPGLQFSIHVDEGNYAIECWTGNGLNSLGSLLYATPNNSWIGGVGFFLECHIKIATSGAGFVQFWVDGVSVGSASITTQQTGNAWFDVVDFAASPFSGLGSTVYLDDFYYNDTTIGAGLYPCNGPVGDSRVVTTFATGNDAVQFTPLAGANWQEVSEVAMDSDTSYNFDATAGHQDTFTFGAIESTINTFYGLQVTYAVRKDDAGAHTMEGVVKISGTSHYPASANAIPAGSTYTYFSDLWILSPASGLNFTLTEINGADFGYKLVT